MSRLNIRQCSTCDFYEEFSGVCVNGDSENKADFMFAEDLCDKWKAREKLHNKVKVKHF